MAKHHEATPDLDLNASLARLGVRELEERMELAPLLAAAGDVQDADACSCSCECDDTPPDPVDPFFDTLRRTVPTAETYWL